MRKLLILPIFLCYLLSAQAQITLSTSSHQVERGDIFLVDVKAAGLNDLISMQYTVKWDSTLLRLISVGDYSLEYLDDDKFGAFSNALTLAWIDQTTTGISVEDGTTLYTIRFEAIADEGKTNLEFASAPTAIEAVNNAGELLEFNSDAGIVQIGEMTSVEALAQYGMYMHQNDPNPFRDYTNINIEANDALSGEFAILDQTGKKIYSVYKHLSRGNNLIRLEREIFPAPGIYYYQLQTADFTRTNRMIFLR
ncbi:MAG: T9SS type A sorting domain-containing protein [Bacteroidota bacterium]